MKFYEVILRLVNANLEIGRTCIHIQAASPFNAAVQAEQQVDASYHFRLNSHVIKVNSIQSEEYLAELTA